MMILASLAMLTITVLPADRMAMADRLFDRARYSDARAEYVALKGAAGVDEAKLLYCIAESNRMLGDGAAARAAYGELLEKFPLSDYSNRARLQRALAGTPEEQKAELPVLDSDSVPNEIRAAALYNYGIVARDAAALAKAVKVEPKGPYEQYAKLRHAEMTANDPDPAVRRAAIGELMEVFFGQNKALSRDALYLAATKCYSNKSYSEAASLFTRYLKKFPNDERGENARKMAAWAHYLSGKYADAVALCGEGRTDDAAYLLAACAYASGDAERAKTLIRKYLDDYPHGAYRKAVELPLARMEFEAAERSSDVAGAVEAAKRAAALSKNATDRLRLAWAYEKGARESDAYAEYEAIVKAFPGTEGAAEAAFRKAMIDIRAKRWSPAELALAEALGSGKNQKRRGEMLYWRGIAACAVGHKAQGAGFLREALTFGLTLDQKREAELLLADFDYDSGNLAAAKDAYVRLVREGAAERMSAAKMRAVGRFILDCGKGEAALGEVKACAKALVAAGGSAEWRQAGYALLGDAEAAGSEFSAAIESYRKCMAEGANTEDAAAVALKLGVLENKAGDYGAAEKTLKDAVRLNSGNARRRAEAYLALARNAELRGDARGACAYATVVVSLFDDSALNAEADKILKAHPEEAR